MVLEDELIGVLKNSTDTAAFVMERISEISSSFIKEAQKDRELKAAEQVNTDSLEKEMQALKEQNAELQRQISDW